MYCDCKIFSASDVTFSKIELTQVDSLIYAPNFTTCAAILTISIDISDNVKLHTQACPVRSLLKIVAFAVSEK